MAYTEFCCRSGGSNLNAGTRTGSTSVPGTSADLTYASGNWVQSTRVFTVASGNPSSDGVAVGDYVSVYADGSTVTGYVAQVTARDATTITLSATVKAGTAPSDGTGNRTLKVGGAWKGPNGAEAFPIGFAHPDLLTTAARKVRVNFRNDADYVVSAAMTTSGAADLMVYQGFSSSYGDFGRATIDGGSAGSSYVVLTNGQSYVSWLDIIFKNNGASGSANLVENTSGQVLFARCVFTGARGSGISLAAVASGCLVECEAYGNNTSNTSGKGGFQATSAGVSAVRCIAHDNTTGNSFGFNGFSYCFHCIADTNGDIGFVFGNQAIAMINCDSYNNGNYGVTLNLSVGIIANCNFVKNGLYGVYPATSGGVLWNNGFGSGTMANTSGMIDTTGINNSFEIAGSVTYPLNQSPWVDPANGDFRISLPEAKGAGRGAYTQTASGYGSSVVVGYPDIGAIQHREAGNSPLWAFVGG